MVSVNANSGLPSSGVGICGKVSAHRPGATNCPGQQLGVVTSRVGKELPSGYLADDLLYEPVHKGTLRHVLPPGRYPDHPGTTAPGRGELAYHLPTQVFRLEN